MDISASLSKARFQHREIDYATQALLEGVEDKHPGTLLNNCSYELWQRRYRNLIPEGSTSDPWQLTSPLVQPLSECMDAGRHISQSAVQFRSKKGCALCLEIAKISAALNNQLFTALITKYNPSIAGCVPIVKFRSVLIVG